MRPARGWGAVAVGAGMLLAIGGGATPVRAETGADAWLRYAPLDATARSAFARLPAVVVTLEDSPVITAARDEISRGVRGLLGRTLRQQSRLPDEPAIVLATSAALAQAGVPLPRRALPRHEGYVLLTVGPPARRRLVVTGASDRAVLYGAFALLRRIALATPVDALQDWHDAAAPIRWVNNWDNLDGTIERGYGGPSIFFEGGRVRADLTRVGAYARLLASIGINACAINNVNADSRVIADSFLPDLARVAAAMRPWGVRLVVSVDFSAPMRSGGLATFDPLDAGVAGWWRERAAALYRAVPDLAGFVLKADSEGRLGPSAYKRTHADAANVIARALAPFKGVLLYRGFVYDHHMDWRNPRNDRARAAYDNFHDLDGQFLDNVVLQIKHGPIDFQVREPASPLFNGLERTNEAIELQITQEYLGQQRHVVFIAPMWKEVLDFDTRARGPGTTVTSVITGKAFGRPAGGFVGVANVGMDANWLGHDLAQANLYAFGRLAFDPGLPAQRICDEWTRQTFGHDPSVVRTISRIQMASWPAYEAYTGPLGAGTLTDIIGVHFGPGVESSERNGWGQWHRADAYGIGMDRTVKTGTGFIGQYMPSVAARYESLATCPDDLLLFMHHVPYTHRLKSGKTVIQHIYDAHYAGAAAALEFAAQWSGLRGKIDDDRWQAVGARLEFQAGHARVWRDAVNTWFQKTSGIDDAHKRVGRTEGRVEAESLTLDGYQAVDVTPWETASRGRAVECRGMDGRCSARLVYRGTAGWRTLIVQYYDTNPGRARFAVSVNGQPVAQWTADGDVPRAEPNGHTATWRRLTGLALRPGDEIRVDAEALDKDLAVLDYLEIVPEPVAIR